MINNNSSANSKWMALTAISAVIFGFLIYVLSDRGSGIGVGNTLPDPERGGSLAQIVLEVYSDYECPYCRSAEVGLAELSKKYPNSVKVRFNDFPLPQHKNAYLAALAAQCAFKKGKFWEYHDQVFEHQADWSGLADPRGKLSDYAKTVGLNEKELEVCVEQKNEDASIKEDLAEGNNYRISGTPTIFVKGERFVGSKTLAEWEAVLRPQGLVEPRASPFR